MYANIVKISNGFPTQGIEKNYTQIFTATFENLALFIHPATVKIQLLLVCFCIIVIFSFLPGSSIALS